jgi:hypothetical protein
MFARFRILAGLLAIATIVLAVPTISKAQFVMCVKTLDGPVRSSQYWLSDVVFDNTPCQGGATYGVIYRKATDTYGGEWNGYWTAHGNCTCP